MAYVVKAGGLVALIALALGVMSGTGYKMGWWGLDAAFPILSSSFFAGCGAATLGLIGLIFSRQKGLAAGTLAVGGLIALSLMMQYQTAQSVPPIHDITTDTDNPPQFVKILALRPEGSNSLDYANKTGPAPEGEEGKSYKEIQEAFYTDIKPMFIKLALAPCHVVAVKAAFKQGWEVVNADDEVFIIEAVDTTLWFGFKDDVVIRITEEEGSCRVDMRSSSRVGTSDVGVNADRIMNYMATLKKLPKVS
jgi:uncharacterized protein (DUF1499 family)